MGLLRVLDLAGVLPRRLGHGLGPEDVAGGVAGRGDRGGRQRRRVGTHVRDVAVLVQPLGDPHRGLAGVAQLAAGLLLQRRGHERRGRRAAVRLLVHRTYGEGCVGQGRSEPANGDLVQRHDLGAATLGGSQRAVAAEVAASGDAGAVKGDEPGRERAGVEDGVQVPVPSSGEGDPLALALDDQPGGHGLHAARGQALHDLLPQHRADLVPVQPVDDPAGLLRVDQLHVEVAGVLGGLADGVAGDLVEDHPADRDLGLQDLEQVPGDRLALAVLVRREQQLVRVLEQALELGDLAALVGVDDVERLEALLDVHAEPGPGLALLVGRDVRGAGGQVADVADAGLDVIARAEVALDRLGLGGALDDDKPSEAAWLLGFGHSAHFRSRLAEA